jgi:hypothetical protein
VGERVRLRCGLIHQSEGPEGPGQELDGRVALVSRRPQPRVVVACQGYQVPAVAGSDPPMGGCLSDGHRRIAAPPNQVPPTVYYRIIGRMPGAALPLVVGTICSNPPWLRHWSACAHEISWKGTFRACWKTYDGSATKGTDIAPRRHHPSSPRHGWWFLRSGYRQRRTVVVRGSSAPSRA